MLQVLIRTSAPSSAASDKGVGVGVEGSSGGGKSIVGSVGGGVVAVGSSASPSTDMHRHALASALNIVHFFLFGTPTMDALSAGALTTAIGGLDESLDGTAVGGRGIRGVEESLVVLSDVGGIATGMQSMDISRDSEALAPLSRGSSSHLRASLPPALYAELETHAVVVAEKLLAVASSAAADESAGASGVVHNALKTITYLIRDPEVASQLISNNPQSRSLLTTVLRSNSKKVREMSADFAIQVGLTQPVVFGWLMAEMETLDPSDAVCSDIFRALGTLVVELSTVPDAVDLQQLGALLSQRLVEYPRSGDAKHPGRANASSSSASGGGNSGNAFTPYLPLSRSQLPPLTHTFILTCILSSLLLYSHSYTPTYVHHALPGSSSGVSSSSDEQQVLTGYLELLEKVIRIDPHVIPANAFNGNLVKTFLNEFLFTMPTDDEQDKTPICDHVNTRHAAFGVISAYLAMAPQPFQDALQEGYTHPFNTHTLKARTLSMHTLSTHTPFQQPLSTHSLKRPQSIHPQASSITPPPPILPSSDTTGELPLNTPSKTPTNTPYPHPHHPPPQ